MKIFIFFAWCGIAVAGGPASVWDRPVTHLRFEKAPIGAALRALARGCDTTLIVEPDVTGDVTAELNGSTLRGALTALIEPLGYYAEETSVGITVRKMKTVLYTIDYPQLTRSGSGSASITLGGQNSGSSGYGNGTQPLPATTLASGQNGLQNTSDATQISITQENQNSFWTSFEAELRAMLVTGETLVLNRFSGVVQITATARRHDSIRAFIEFTNKRITQQVEIEARLVEVTLHDERKLGIDWDLATSTAAAATVAASAPLNVVGVGGTVFDGDSFTANLGRGRTTAVLHALEQQGEVRTVSQPRLRALNNQTAFVKVGQDQPFFRLQQTTTLNQPGTTVPFQQSQDTYSVSTITIGTILAVTPQVGADRVITLDVLPAITRLQSIVTSPDGKQTAPVSEVKQASTIVRLRDGETAVIGGLISEGTGTVTRAVPVLGKIPVLGRAFRTEAKQRDRTELVIFLTPHLTQS